MRVSLTLLAGAAGALLACAHTDPLVVSGESLDALGGSFISTSAAMDQALSAKQITAEQYRTWAAFGERFQVEYRPAVQLWMVARQVQDKPTEAAVAAILTQLAADLAALTQQVLIAHALADGGAP